MTMPTDKTVKPLQAQRIPKSDLVLVMVATLGTVAYAISFKVAEVFRDESAWQESPLTVFHARWGFFDCLAQHDAHLELATRVEPLDYRWQLGRSCVLRRPLDG